MPGLVCWALGTVVFSIFDGGETIAKLFQTPTLPFALGHAISTGPPAVVAAGVLGVPFYVVLIPRIILDTIVGAAVFIGADKVLQGRAVDLPAILRKGVSRLGMLFLFYLYCAVALLLAGIVTAVSFGFALIIVIPAAICGIFFALLLVFPAIAIDGVSAQEAVASGWRLALWDPYRIASLAFTLLVVDIVESAIRFIPLVGGIFSVAVGLILSVVQVLVITKTYRSLTTSAAADAL